MKQKKRKKKLTPEQKKERALTLAKQRTHRNFVKKFCTVFSLAGFTTLDTENKEFQIGNKRAELDKVFIYENIIVVCEETTSSSTHIKDHILHKKETAEEIFNNKKQFITFLSSQFTTEASVLANYDVSELKLKFVYFSLYDTNFSIEDRARFTPWKIVELNILSYLYQSAVGIKKSVKYEVYRFLEISDADFTLSSSTGQGTKDVTVSIIYPERSTGRNDGVRLVSFMLSAETLIKNSYVLRKDNWENSIGLYQRLIDLNKIKDIRKFIYDKGECFYNNIIVALPDGVRFTDENENSIFLDNISQFRNCTMHIPNQMNSICVIDGQHRIFAHYEGDQNDPLESKIAQLRKRLHLLVTGLIFPSNMPQSERIKIQSEIFAEINSKSKPIPPDVLLHIEMLREPLSPISLARQILENLNGKQAFLNYFEFSPLKPAKLKVASIIKFALRYLVDIEPGEDRISLFTLWNEKDKHNIKIDDAIKNAFIDFCVKYLTEYFSAIRQVYNDEWEDAKSKILSVIAFNSFILTLKKDITAHGLQDRDYYLNAYSKHKFDFSKENFLYTSSQYNKFSDEIIDKCFSDKTEITSDIEKNSF